MKIKASKYRWCWDTFSLWRDIKYEGFYSPVFDCVIGAGESKRIFTLSPRLIVMAWKNR